MPNHDSVFDGDVKPVREVFEGVSYRGRSDAFIVQSEINGNHYVILYGGPDSETIDRDDQVFIEVWADYLGRDVDLPDRVYSLGKQNYDVDDTHELLASYVEEYRFHLMKGVDFMKKASEILNEAVCNLEDKHSREQEFADAVNAAIEGTKSVHEGIDYELESSE